MSREERLKAELSWFKFLFGAFLAIEASLIAWVVQKFHTAPTVLLVGTFVVIVGVGLLMGALARLIHKKFNQLEEC